MASDGDKVSVALDATIVADVRRVVDPAVKSDAAAVERALNAYLLGRLVDRTQARSDLGTEDAEHVAYDEVHAQRREDHDAMLRNPTDAPAAVSASELVRGMRERNARRRAAVLRHVAALRRLAERLRKASR
jgi:predicted RNA-binding Zn ribbon-like protein